MRALLLGPLLGSVLVFGLAACSPTTSSLTLQPGERFILGGPGDGAFRIELANEGAVAVDVAEQRLGGDVVALGVLEPGASLEASFAAGAAAVLSNPSASAARVRAEIRGGGDLSMVATEAD